MKLTLDKADTAYVDIEGICQKIAGIVSGHSDLLDILCNLLLYITESSGNIWKQIDNFFNNFGSYVQSVDLNAYKELKEYMQEYYALIQDFEFDTKLRTYHPREYKAFGLEDNTQKINIFRGILFEHITAVLVEPRYLHGVFATGCRIKINHQLILIAYGKGNSSHKKTIDIAGWDDSQNCGEFYECKIRPLNFKEENLRYLEFLFSKLAIHSEQCKVGLITADTTLNAESKARELNVGQHLNIQCIGRDKMMDLKNFSFSLAV